MNAGPDPRPWYDDDDRLAEELAVALRTNVADEADRGPDADVTAMLVAGYDIVMTDTIEADLVHDSDVDELAAVRSGDLGARMLTYAEPETGSEGSVQPGVEIAFEIVDGRVVGHIDPPTVGRVLLEQPTNGREMVVGTEPDDLGSFEFELRNPSTFRLRYIDADGRSVATAWLDGPHPTIGV